MCAFAFRREGVDCHRVRWDVGRKARVWASALAEIEIARRGRAPARGCARERARARGTCLGLGPWARRHVKMFIQNLSRRGNSVCFTVTCRLFTFSFHSSLRSHSQTRPRPRTSDGNRLGSLTLSLVVVRRAARLYTPPDRAVTYSLVSHAGRHVGNALPVRAKWDHVHFDVIETACVRAANRIGIEGTMAVRAFRGGVRTCGKPWARAGADEHLCRWRQLATRFVTRIHVRLEEMLVPWDVQPGPWPGEIVCLMRLDAWVI